jgi:hypothetical protein
MNGNGVGATTLAYLRGEKDLLQERDELGQIRKQLQNQAMGIGLSEAQKRKVERFWKVASLLQENSRMSITEMSKRLKYPISTLFDILKEVEKHFHFTIVLKDGEKDASGTASSPLEFGYQITMDASEEDGKQKAPNSS